MKKLYGVVTAMTTPFLANGEVDFESLDEQVDYLIAAGVNCLYPCGTTGEMHLMTPEQREAVAERVVKRAAGRVVVYVHAGAVRFDETVRLCRHAHAIGADGVGVVSPSFFGLNDREMTEFYVAVADSLPKDFPVYMYNIPQCAANDIKASVCEEVAARCSNVVGIKYSYCDFNRTMDYLKVRGGDFSVLVGFDRLLVPALDLGCDGTVSGCSSVWPEPFVEMYRAYLSGDREATQKAIWKASDIIVKLKAGASMAVFKAAQQLRGYKGGHMKAPLLDLTEAERAALKQELAGYID